VVSAAAVLWLVKQCAALKKCGTWVALSVSLSRVPVHRPVPPCEGKVMRATAWRALL
jgi:hypothetical protein